MNYSLTIFDIVIILLLIFAFPKHKI